jgi:hypothetical protein
MDIESLLMLAFRDIYISCLINEYDDYSIILEIDFELDLRPSYTTPTSMFLYMISRYYILYLDELLTMNGYSDFISTGVHGKIRVYHKLRDEGGQFLERGYSAFVHSSEINYTYVSNIWSFLSARYDDYIYEYYWCFDVDESKLFTDVCLDDETEYWSSD